MKKVILIVFNLILATFMLTGCMYDTTGSDNINPNPDINIPQPDKPVNPDKPIDPEKPVDGFKAYSGQIAAMNTVITFSMYAPSKDIANQVYNRVKAIYEEYDNIADDGFDSVFGQNYNSELARLNRDRRITNPSKALVELVEFAELMKVETNGYFNPFLGELNHMWKKYIDGLGTMPSLGEKNYFTNIAKETKTEYKNNVLAIIGEGDIDLGGVAKGYATEKVYEYLVKAQVKHFLLNAGNSNIVAGEHFTKDKYTIGISYTFGYPNNKPVMEIKDGTLHIDGIDTKLKSRTNVSLKYGSYLEGKPKNGDIFFVPETAEYFVAENGVYQLKGSLTLTKIDVKNQGVCTSNPGQQHKKGDRHTHHLINPFTGEPANYRDSVTIVGVDSGRLDAYSTAIFSMPDAEAIRFITENNLEGLLVKEDKVYYQTEGL